MRNNPLKYTDPSGHTYCIDSDCSYVANPISGEILQHLRTQTDPIFGDKDFLSRNPIPAYTGINPVFINGWISANKLQQVSDEYSVPGELIATVLQLENNPRFGVWGVSRRAIKVRMTQYLQIVDPKHVAGLGYSQGIGNMKPGVAQENSEYFMDYYPGEQSVERYWTHFQLGSPGHNVEHIAAHLRKQIDSVYWFGYEGPMSIEGMALVITKYNRPINTSPSGYGLEGRALLIDASKGAANLIFWRQ